MAPRLNLEETVAWRHFDYVCLLSAMVHRTSSPRSNLPVVPRDRPDGKSRVSSLVDSTLVTNLSHRLRNWRPVREKWGYMEISAISISLHEWINILKSVRDYSYAVDFNQCSMEHTGVPWASSLRGLWAHLQWNNWYHAVVFRPSNLITLSRVKTRISQLVSEW